MGGQDSFSAQMGRVFDLWANSTDQSLQAQFNGSDSSINYLTQLISDGKLIAGRSTKGRSTEPSVPGLDNDEILQRHITRALFAYAIPELWRWSDWSPFIMEMDAPCDADVSLLIPGLDADVAKATRACYNGLLYFLSTPMYSKPPGLDELASASQTDFGGLNMTDLVVG